MMKVLLLIFFQFYYSSGYYFHNPYSKWIREGEENAELNLNNTFFPTLKGYQVNAKETTELIYPWIARVIHSQKNKVPYMCTAASVDERIFITAARCVYLLKVKFTSIIYQNQRLKVKALVMPSTETKQMFDDIGLIVVHEGFKGKWASRETYGKKRTDNAFHWLEEPKYTPFVHRVVGYTTAKNSVVYPTWNNIYHLTELDVVFDMDLCREIMTYENKIDGFKVPCYHSCTLEMFKKTDEKCKNYHGAIGSAVYNTEQNIILGIATWGAYYRNFEVPVGFAVPNSDNYFIDLACARKVREDTKPTVAEGYYQELCDKSK